MAGLVWVPGVTSGRSRPGRGRWLRLGLSVALVAAMFGLVPLSSAGAAKVLPISIVDIRHPTISHPGAAPLDELFASGNALTGVSGIAAGPDGAMWFVNTGNDSIGRVTMAGVVTNYTSSAVDEPTAIVAGPDGAMWFTNRGLNQGVARIAMDGTITKVSVAGTAGIAVGPDGALWMSSLESFPGVVHRLTTSGALTGFSSNDLSPSGPIAAGPDGQMWVVSHDFGAVRKISMSGVITKVANGLTQAIGLVKGPDGAMWTRAGPGMARITPAGQVTYVKKTVGVGFVLGPDGAFWGVDGHQIRRLTPSGASHTYNTIRPGAAATMDDIAVGPDGNLWFTRTNPGEPVSTHGVSRANLKPKITTASIPSGKVGVAYSKALTATDGLLPMKWKKVSPLPKGLKLVGKTGLLTGTPKTAGTYTVTVQVKAKFNPGKLARTVNKSFPLTIVP